jgi:Uma2 family endonuclease
MGAMRTVVLGERPVEVEHLLKRRRELGQDLFDEVWEGDYHIVPVARGRHGFLEDELASALRPAAKAANLVGTGPVNVGEPNDYRVPDRAYHRHFDSTAVYYPTAAIVVEIVSPYDETYAKFGFYAGHKVDEIITADPDERRVRCWRRDERGTDYAEADASALLDVSASELTAGIDWP